MIPKPQPQPVPQTDNPRGDGEIPAIRTYRSDVEEAISSNQTSVSDMALAESNRRRERGEPEPSRKKTSKTSIFTAIGSFLLITLGLVAVGYVLFLPKDRKPDSAFKPTSFILTDKQTEISISGTMTKKQLIDTVNKFQKESKIPLGEIWQIYFAREQINNLEDKPLKTEIAFGEFMESLGANPPTFFTRAIKGGFMIGYFGYSGNQPFIIAKVDSYDNAFGGMVRYEKDIPEDFGSILIAKRITSAGILQSFATSTATSTKPSELAATTTADATKVSQIFTDKIIQNKDVRVLKKEGQIVFLYSFVDKETLVMTTGEKPFEEILKRLKSAKLVR